jgi:2-keto-4-pentenoate hydratase
LAQAYHSCAWLTELPGSAKPNNSAEAYAVQAAFLARMQLPGVGWKIGCTSRATQELLGTDQPMAGRLLAQTTLTAPALACAIRPDMPFVESEFAFRLGADLPPRQAAYASGEVAAAIATVMPAIEIIQCRYCDWKTPTLWESIADNSAHGWLVVGEAQPFDQGRDLSATAVTLTSDDQPIANGTGSAVLGDPLNAMVWLANFASAMGVGLNSGELVASGTCTGLSKAPMDALVTANFAGLGSVSVRLMRLQE